MRKLLFFLFLLISNISIGQTFHSNKQLIQYDTTKLVFADEVTFEFSKQEMRMIIYFDIDKTVYEGFIYSDEIFGFSVETPDGIYEFYTRNAVHYGEKIEVINMVIEYPKGSLVSRRVYRQDKPSNKSKTYKL